MRDDELPDLQVSLREARKKQIQVSIVLDAPARQILADQNHLGSLDSFSFVGNAISPSPRTIQLTGHLVADLHYVCGVSLRPFAHTIGVDVDQMFGDPGRTLREIDLDPNETSDLEPLRDGTADVSDIVYQLFALALEPYPRHPDLPAAQGQHQDELSSAEDAASPFAVLRDLKSAD